MKKGFRKVLAIFLTLAMFLTAAPMTFSASATEDELRQAVFSLNAVSETDTEFVVCVKLEDGAFSSVDFGISYNEEKFEECTKIVNIFADDFVAISNTETGLFSGACATGWSEKGSVIATYTYKKVYGTRATKNDLTLDIYNCTSFEHLPVEAQVINKLYGENIAFGVCGDNAEWVLYENGELQITGSGAMYNYSSDSPAPWDKYRSEIRSLKVDGVTSIGNDTFFGCANLETAELSDSVTKIGNTAFRDCTSLAEIEIPAAVKSVGHYAFYGCSALGSLVLPEGVQSVGKHAFRKCTDLRIVQLPLSVESIADNAFEGCLSLSSVFYAGQWSDWHNVTVGIGNEPLTGRLVFALYSGICGEGVIWALTEDGELIVDGNGRMYDYPTSADVPWAKLKRKIKAIRVCDGVTYIGSSAFSGCSDAEMLSIPASAQQHNSRSVYDACTSVELITVTKGNGTMCDYGTDSSVSSATTYYKYAPWNIIKCPKVVIDEGVTNVGAFAFAYNDSIEEVVLPTSLRKIGDNAFYNCFSLVCVWLYDNVESIGRYAFYACTSLDYLVIPTGIDSIGKSAFRFCEKLEYLYYDGTEYEWSLVDVEDWAQEVTVWFLVSHNSPNDTITVLYDIPVTCTTDGEKAYYCRCGMDFKDITPALGHNFTEWDIKKEPTCTQTGYKTRKCLVCGHIDDEIIPALGMVRGVTLYDMTVNYMDIKNVASKITVDDGVGYTVVYTSSDTSVVTIDSFGTFNAVAKGTATVTCTVTDEYGNVATDTCEITVNYSFGQWLIVIFLFGWIWY